LPHEEDYMATVEEVNDPLHQIGIVVADQRALSGGQTQIWGASKRK
jgi:hypothetical protein